MDKDDLVSRAMRSIEATAPNANEGLVFTYGQVERGVRASLESLQSELLEALRRTMPFVYEYAQGEHGPADQEMAEEVWDRITALLERTSRHG